MYLKLFKMVDLLLCLKGCLIPIQATLVPSWQAVEKHLLLIFTNTFTTVLQKWKLLNILLHLMSLIFFEYGKKDHKTFKIDLV